MTDNIKKIGVNGIAGRIGKFAAYELIQLGEKIESVNDLATTDTIIGSLAHKDGVHGELDWQVEKVNEDMISINGDIVMVYHEKDPANIVWGDNVYAVCECAGPFTKKENAEKHFAKTPTLETVLISAPGEGEMKTLVMGVNHTYYEKGDRVISNASCTTKAIAMPLKALLDAGVSVYAVLMDTTHAATNTQKPLDFISTYGVLDVIQSAKTGAAKATGKVISELLGKMDGFAMRVPTRDGSFANVYFNIDAGYNGETLNKNSLNKILVDAKDNPRYCNRLDIFSGAEVASPNIIDNTASSVIAVEKTMIIPFQPETKILALCGIVSGYDNERGPAKDLAMLTQYVLRKE